MEIRVLKYFHTIAEVGTISHAAQLLNITQPTLSRQLKDLEEELGTQLFTREKNRMELTEAGYFLKSRAEELLAISEQTLEDFQSRKGELFSGHLNIGSVEADNSDTLAMILEEFLSDFPQVTFHIQTGTSPELIEQLDKGLLDVAILLEPTDVHKYEKLVLPHAEKWGFATHKSSPLSKKTWIEPHDVQGIPMLLAQRKSIQDLICQWGNFQIDDLNVIGTYNWIANVDRLVENKVGSLITIEAALSNRKTENIVFIPLKPEMKTNCVLVWKKSRVLSLVAKEFVERFKYAFEA